MKFYIKSISASIVPIITIIVFQFVSSAEIKGQEKIEYQKFSVNSAGEKKVINLTEEAKKRCNDSIKKQIGENYIEIKFPTNLKSEAEKISVALEKSMRKTQEILLPLTIENLRFYFYQREEIPSRYRIVDELQGEKFLLYLEIFSGKEYLDLDCSDKDELCRGIYSVIPHELAHGAIENWIDHKDQRWFDEGLAEYVGAEVSRNFRDVTFEEKLSEVSLHRAEIRESLWGWESDANKLNKDESLARNQYFRYKAAQQLIKLVVREAKKKYIVNPLSVLFNELIKHKKNIGKPATNQELIEIIRESLKVNPKELGVLSEQSQKQLIDEALNILSQTEKTNGRKYYALNVLMSIDEIALSREWMNFLLKEFFNDRDAFARQLAASALFRRSNQKDFDESVKTFFQRTSKSNEKSLGALKTELQKLSLRPLIR